MTALTSATANSLRLAILLTLANGSLDAYTFIARGNTFANVQTANVIFVGIGLSRHDWPAVLAQVYPIVAFSVGTLVAVHLKSGRAPRLGGYPLAWVMALQACVLFGIGFVPSTVPHGFVTVPIAFLAGTQIGLFRSVGDLGYLPVATTGNSLRLVETGYSALVDKSGESWRAFGVYGGLILSFGTGALIGALLTHAFDVRAIWVSAALIAIAGVMFVVEKRSSARSEVSLA
jgi:uncharacterized membrane protein YoaK (UPF0700 family)